MPFNQSSEMKKYRFKTEEELVQEFGEGWRAKISVPWNFSGQMDYLLGSPLSEEHNKLANQAQTFHIDRWKISRDSLTEIKELVELSSQAKAALKHFNQTIKTLLQPLISKSHDTE
jgi:hypothetical protein